MTRLLLIVLFFSCFSFDVFANAQHAVAAEPYRPLALVYFGPGVCQGCPESLAAAIKTAGFEVLPVRAGDLTEALLARTALFAVPGGDEERDVIRALLPGEIGRIRSFVANGGHYLGVCLGAYLAATWLNDSEHEGGLDLIKGKIPNHSPTKEARMEDVLWKGHHRWLYFQDGPEFILGRRSRANVWAYYKDGSIAALQTPFKKGRVGLIGPHLEAEQSWWDEDHLVDPDGPDEDLMIDFLRELVPSYRGVSQ